MSRVYVGMSGGVDSSVAAAMLVDQGHEVTGIYMKNWTEDLPGMKCPWAEDLADAKRVAVQLGIDFRVYDFQAEYKQYVVNYMVGEYRAGRTPNPDIMCNQEVKFKLFLDAALHDGAEFIATGHYARTHDGRLFRAKDENKDQTYFLYRVSSQALEKTLFPLGDLTKQEVRAIAEQKKLYTATKKESMGVCFVGQVSMKDFLSQYVTTQTGNIVDQQTNQIIGRHDGAIFFTIGQRHGLEVGGGLPYYVVGKDMDSNTVLVSRQLHDAAMWRKQIELTDIHWINQSAATDNMQIRMRHRAKLIPGCLFEYTLSLAEPERAVTSGQSAVFYVDDECVGGGIVA